MKIGITFASVHEEYEKDPLRTLDEIKRAGYELFEVARYDKLGRDEFAQALKTRDIRPISGHFGWQDFEADMYEDTLSFAGVFGIDTLVIPWCHPDAVKDYAATVETAKRLDALAAKVKERGFDLLFHNHITEFEDVYEGKCVEDIFYENTSLLGFELDLGWAYAGGCDLVPYIRKLNNRLKIVHIKDVNSERTPVEIGTGLVNMRECLDAAVSVGVKYGIVEQDVSPEKRMYPPFESIRISRDNLHRFGY
jgi:sugar phosphate isomerase/epimerase